MIGVADDDATNETAVQMLLLLGATTCKNSLAAERPALHFKKMPPLAAPDPALVVW
jgi:hypothetical protein